MMAYYWVACERRNSINSGAWLRRFDDVTGVEKSCVAKGINRKKQRKNIFLLQINMRFPQTSNTWMFAMFKNFIHSQLLKLIFLSPNHCETRKQELSNFRTDFFYRGAVVPNRWVATPKWVVEEFLWGCEQQPQ